MGILLESPEPCGAKRTKTPGKTPHGERGRLIGAGGEKAAQQFAREVAIHTDEEAKDFNIVRRPSSGYAQQEEDERRRGRRDEETKEARRPRTAESSSSSSNRRPSGSKPPTTFWDPYTELPPARQ